MDKNSIKIVNLHSKENDFAFWKTQPVEKRLEALEELRIQFTIWKYGAEQGFQRVYRVIDLSKYFTKPI
jgi:hypothetical protein